MQTTTLPHEKIDLNMPSRKTNMHTREVNNAAATKQFALMYV
jgi:hypothetical protein